MTIDPSPRLRFTEFADPWEVTRIATLIADIETGVSVNSLDHPARTGEMGVLKTSSVVGGRFFPTENKAISGLEVDRARIHPRAGSIIVSRINTMERVGENGLVLETRDDLFLPDRLWQLRIDESKADARWVSLALTTHKARARIAAKASGTSGSMKNISRNGFASLELATPSVVEQEKIADFLSAVDQKIEAIHTRVRLLTDCKKGYVQRLFAASPSDGAQEQLTHMRAFFSERDSANEGSETGELLSVSQYDGVVPHRLTGARDSSSVDKSQYKRVEVGDLVYNTMRMWQGAFGFSEYAGFVSPAYTVATPVEGVSTGYFQQLFKTQRALDRFAAFSQGLTSDTWNLRFGHFADVAFVVPDEQSQMKISDFLGAIDVRIRLEREKLALARQWKSALMQQMFS